MPSASSFLEGVIKSSGVTRPLRFLSNSIFVSRLRASRIAEWSSGCEKGESQLLILRKRG